MSRRTPGVCHTTNESDTGATNIRKGRSRGQEVRTCADDRASSLKARATKRARRNARASPYPVCVLRVYVCVCFAVGTGMTPATGVKTGEEEEERKQRRRLTAALQTRRRRNDGEKHAQQTVEHGEAGRERQGTPNTSQICCPATQLEQVIKTWSRRVSHTKTSSRKTKKMTRVSVTGAIHTHKRSSLWCGIVCACVCVCMRYPARCGCVRKPSTNRNEKAGLLGICEGCLLSSTACLPLHHE